MDESVLQTEVLVVGAGVTGSILALELAHHGVASLVVERASRPPGHLEIDHLGGRSLELLRRLGLMGRLRDCGVDPDIGADVVWSRGLDRPPVLVSSLPSINQLRGSWAGVDDGSTPRDPYQRLSGALLTSQLREVVRLHQLVDLREGWTFTDLRSEPEGVVATVLEAGTGIRHVVRARFLAGCDGGQSTVRRCLDVPMDPLKAPAPHFSIYFRSRDLSRRSGRPRPSTIIVGGLTLVSRDDQDSWIGHLPLASGESMTTDPVALLRGRLGIGLEPPQVSAVSQWDDSLAVATAYRSGPVYLAGESAHRFHPVGESADTSIGDAVNLGWKLAAAVTGWGGPDLLASYELERRPRALMDRELLERAVETRQRFGRLAQAGASPEFLAGVLRQEPPQTDAVGATFANRYASSSVICGDAADRATSVPRRDTPAPRPGDRLPALRLRGGGELFDRLGPEFTLLDLTADEDGRALAGAAADRRIPVAHVPIADGSLPARWDHRLVLVRPDQYIAWGAGTPPGDWDAVLDVVTGQKTP